MRRRIVELLTQDTIPKTAMCGRCEVGTTAEEETPPRQNIEETLLPSDLVRARDPSIGEVPASDGKVQQQAGKVQQIEGTSRKPHEHGRRY